MKPEFKIVKNTNPKTGETSNQLQGIATLVSMQPLRDQKNSNGTAYTLGTIEFEKNGEMVKQSAQIYEKSIESVTVGQPVAISVASANGKTYFRVIGSTTPNVADDDLFNELSAGLEVPAEEEEEEVGVAN